ncbi:MAG: hypothetical protein R3E50_09885 [Halioglobus sp.]
MNVKIGMNMLLWGTHITPEHIPVFAELAAAGYDGVEIPVVGQSPEDLKTMAAACDDLGLARTASAFVDARANLISAPIPAGWRRGQPQEGHRRCPRHRADILIGGSTRPINTSPATRPRNRSGRLVGWITCAPAASMPRPRHSPSLEFLNRFEVFLDQHVR